MSDIERRYIVSDVKKHHLCQMYSILASASKLLHPVAKIPHLVLSDALTDLYLIYTILATLKHLHSICVKYY